MLENPGSIERLLEKNPLLRNKVRGLPNLGKRLNEEEFSTEVKEIYNAFSIYGNDLYILENEKIKDLETRSLGGGSPMKTGAFPLCKKSMMDTIQSDDMFEYPLAAGDEKSREEIVEYLIKEGFKSKNGVNKYNIIFTISSTQAFNLIMNLIARPHDVVLMTGPNYGLFTFVPERSAGATVEILPLSADDNWQVNPEKLKNKINELNKQLEEKYKDKLDYVPKVVAFLNENPHNPLGKVMGKNESKLLYDIGKVCLEEGVFVIDDIIYRDLTFDRDNMAMPMGTNPELFDNTITITGLSKCYGLASLRAGMIVAPEPIIRGVRNLIFQNMDSSPVLQGKALAGAFNSSNERYIEYEKYFNPIIKEYKYRLELLKALVEGIDYITDLKLKLAIECDIRKYASNDFNCNELLEGIPNVHFLKNSIPDSGFFALLDYSNLKGKSVDGRTITSEIELLKYMYEQEKIKIILGQSISFPNKEQLIGRVTTALERNELINHMGAMNKCLRKLR